MSSPRWRARCRAVLPTLHLGNPMSPSLLLVSLLSRQISATMMSETVERGAPSTGPSNEWNDDDDGHANDADADGSYGSHVPGMDRRLLSNAEFYARYRESGQLNGAPPQEKTVKFHFSWCATRWTGPGCPPQSVTSRTAFRGPYQTQHRAHYRGK